LGSLWEQENQWEG